MTNHPFKELLANGQSFWLDNIRREWLKDGTLAAMVPEKGLRGVTSNPAIFFNAITQSTAYEAQLKVLAREGASAIEIYEALVVSDIQMAADAIRSVYDSSEGIDGFVSLEVSPLLAHDEAGTLAEARRLFAWVDRPNVMIKVPGTPACIPAIEALIADGIPVNVTLLFSTTQYNACAEAYIRGIERRAAEGKPLAGVISVASVFLSRIDSLVDRWLSQRILPDGRPDGLQPANLMGKIAIASVKATYASFETLFGGERFAKLSALGAKVQRPLWASTSIKNVLYSDTQYVEPLIGPNTVNTMPESTVAAFLDHGTIERGTIQMGLDAAREQLAQLGRLGIDLDQVCQHLQDEGVEKFITPFRKLISVLEDQRRAALKEGNTTSSTSAGVLAKSYDAHIKAFEEARFMERLWGADESLWNQDEAGVEVIHNRLGWLRLPAEMPAKIQEIEEFAAAVCAEGVLDVVLLGMGGSSLSPEVAREILGTPSGWPTLHILDSTHPDAILTLIEALNPAKSIVIVASKSGETLETMSFYRTLRAHFETALGEAWTQRFVAITDPGTTLAKEAESFRGCFINPSDIGGRYSVLSAFGLVPMALAGIDVRKLIERAGLFAQVSGGAVPTNNNPAAELGVLMGAAHNAGRNRLSILAPAEFAPFGDWLEQLVAESTGKEGLGLLPVIREHPEFLLEHREDRIFVHYQLAGCPSPEIDAAAAALIAAKQPVVTITLSDTFDVAQEWLRWEIATVACAAVMGINPFDEPDVKIAKACANNQLSMLAEEGEFEGPEIVISAENLSFQLDESSAQMISEPNNASPAEGLLRGFFQPVMESGEYLSIMAYLPPTPELHEALDGLRRVLQAALPGVATTVGIGPRLLHSTGQLYKGGSMGRFLQIVDEPTSSLAIPGASYGFESLVEAQSLGDFCALEARGCKILRVIIGTGAVEDINALSRKIQTAMKSD